MLCPHCRYQHTQNTGRLIALAPTYGVIKTNGGVGTTSSVLVPNHLVARERWQKVESGTWFKCMNCGGEFGLDNEGTFTLPQPKQEQQPPPQRSNGRTQPEPRAPHMMDADLALEPEL